MSQSLRLQFEVGLGRPCQEQLIVTEPRAVATGPFIVEEVRRDNRPVATARGSVTNGPQF